MKKQSIWWQKSVFYDKNPLGIGETPPPFGKKNPTKNSVFSDKEILDWERPPPISKKKIDSFWLLKFWIGWDPPPFRQKNPKKFQSFSD